MLPVSEFTTEQLKDLQPNEEKAEILAMVVQVFDPRFFSVCNPAEEIAKLEKSGGA